MSDNSPARSKRSNTGSPMPVPPLLEDMAGWAWRVLVIGLLLYVLVRFLAPMQIILLPFFAALFATSLAYPFVRFLRRKGMRRAVATALTLFVAAILLAGIAIFVVDRAVSEYSALVTQVSATVTSFRDFLTHDLHVKSSSTASINTTITDYLKNHESSVASGALSGFATIAEGLGAFILWIFFTFFLLYDGNNIWSWIVRLFPPSARPRVRGAGDQAWDRLAGFVRGTFIIALIHAVTAAVALTALRVPLVAPLTLLVFIGSFLPIVGSIIFGALAVAIALVTRGAVLGGVLAGILIVDNQFEAHYLQPVLVGRYVRLHPLVVAVSIAGGGVLAGIPGAVIAVPFVAVVYAVLHYLATGEDQRPGHNPDGSIIVDDPDPPPNDPAEADADSGPADKLVPEAG